MDRAQEIMRLRERSEEQIEPPNSIKELDFFPRNNEHGTAADFEDEEDSSYTDHAVAGGTANVSTTDLCFT